MISDEHRQRLGRLEVILFLSGEPVMPGDLGEATGLGEAEVTALFEELREEYGQRQGGIRIGRIAGGYQMYTDPALSDWARRFRGTVRAQKLSMASLETLSIIAYRQPITKLEVEDLRGVNSDGTIKNLMDRRLIKILGKKEAPGKPMLYGTTKEFLQYFGLSDLSEMPTLRDLQREDSV